MLTFSTGEMIHYINIVFKKRVPNLFFSQQRKHKQLFILNVAYKIVLRPLTHRDTTEKNELIYD